MEKSYIGIDIGGTKCAVILGDRSGNIIEKVQFPTAGINETLENIMSACRKLVRLSGDTVQSVGISCGGPLDPVRGVIQSPPNLPGWDNVEIVRMIRERFGLRAVLCNDANACALAEWKFGAGVGTKNMIFLTFGTGLGAGIIIGGKIYNGANGNAGEVGHIRMSRFGPVGYGKQGSLEGFASGGGIAMMAKTAAIEQLQMGKTTAYCKSFDDLEKISAKTVAEAAESGDETAIRVYRECGEMLGHGLSILVDILNPELIVLGSIFVRSEGLIRPAMEEVMRKECLGASLGCARVVPAGLGDEIGDKAALSLAMLLDMSVGNVD